MSNHDPYSPDPWTPPQYQPTQTTGAGSSWEGGDPPSGRGRTIAIIAGLGVVALVAGIGVGLLVNSGSEPDATTLPAETTTPASNATTAQVTATPGSESSTSIADYSPLSDPPDPAKADFGLITAVSGSASSMKVTFDREQYISATDIRNENKTKRTFTIRPKASLVAKARLNNENGVVKNETLTPEVFLENLRDAIRADGPVPVWLRHTGGLDGDVTALLEYYAG